MGIPGYWFSKNPDKAWGEKFFLLYLPVFVVYNTVMQQMGWLDTGNFWNVTQNLLMWLPFCVLLPAYLRRNSGVPWRQSYWFKYNVYMTVYIFFATYFHTEYFFEVLGLRYNFPQVTLYLDSALLGPDDAVARAEHMKIPPSMYFNAIAFFIVYHTSAVVLMRRVRTMTPGASPWMRHLLWALTVAVTAFFFAWAETFFYVNEAVKNHVWYVDLERMLGIGSICYMLYFLVSFPNIYRMDEDATGERWTISRSVIEAGFVSMVTLLLLDAFAWVYGPITG
jgi:cycloeucalenol cycloisomerase